MRAAAARQAVRAGEARDRAVFGSTVDHAIVTLDYRPTGLVCTPTASPAAFRADPPAEP